MAEYVYIAQQAGILNPFRYVNQGDTVVSVIPLDYPWLVAKADHVVARELPITSAMNVAGSGVTSTMLPPITSHPDYDRAMADIRRAEAIQDGKPDPAIAAGQAQLGVILPNTPADPGAQGTLAVPPAGTPAPPAVPSTTTQTGDGAPQGTGSQDVI